MRTCILKVNLLNEAAGLPPGALNVINSIADRKRGNRTDAALPQSGLIDRPVHSAMERLSARLNSRPDNVFPPLRERSGADTKNAREVSE